MISEFQENYRWLSNFHEMEIKFMGFTFPSTENAYQAAKSSSIEHARKCTICSPAVSKKLGRNCVIRPNWDEIKLQIMFDINMIKYSNEELALMLIHTGTQEIVEGNYWHDNFWGNCYCPRCKGFAGENNLGKIIMKIRDIIGSGAL